MQKNIHLSEPI